MSAYPPGLESNYAILLRIVQTHQRRWWWHRLTSENIDGVCVECGIATLAWAGHIAPSPEDV